MEILQSDEGISLRDFVEFVKHTPEQNRDRHWISQHALNLVDVICPEMIVKLEDFSIAIPNVWEKYFLSEAIVDSKIEANKGKRPKQILTEDVSESIYEIYRKDFEIFGYSKDSWVDF